MSKFIKGMDLSTLLEMERCGAKYYDHGQEMDILDIMKNMMWTPFVFVYGMIQSQKAESLTVPETTIWQKRLRSENE